MAAARRPPEQSPIEAEDEDDDIVQLIRAEPVQSPPGRPVWERLDEDNESEDAAATTTPTAVNIGVIAEDPRKVSLSCECGNPAAYTIKAVRRVLGSCENSSCLRKALEKVEGWAYLAQNKTWDIVQEDKALDTPKPRIPIQEEIMVFQRSQKLDPNGTVDTATESALRREGREGMISVWRSRLLDEVESIDPPTV